MPQDTANDGRLTPGANRVVDTNLAKSENGARQNTMSVMGADILVTGNIEALVDLKIEGRIVGDVRCSTLVLGEASTVTGSITADRVRVAGTVEGAIETTDLAIEAGAHVKGDVTYSRIRIASGAVVEGKLAHRPAPPGAPEAEVEPEADTKLKLVAAPVPTPATAAAQAKPLYFE